MGSTALPFSPQSMRQTKAYFDTADVHKHTNTLRQTKDKQESVYLSQQNGARTPLVSRLGYAWGTPRRQVRRPGWGTTRVPPGLRWGTARTPFNVDRLGYAGSTRSFLSYPDWDTNGHAAYPMSGRQTRVRMFYAR